MKLGGLTGRQADVRRGLWLLALLGWSVVPLNCCFGFGRSNNPILSSSCSLTLLLVEYEVRLVAQDDPIIPLLSGIVTEKCCCRDKGGGGGWSSCTLAVGFI